ncbi:unnamed protein product [Closterium sp. NIES-54]
MAQKGIPHHVSLPYVHPQQGVAERTNRTLMTKVRALLKQSKLPATYSPCGCTTFSPPPLSWGTYRRMFSGLARKATPPCSTYGDLLSNKVTNTRDVIFHERLNLAQYRADEQKGANRVYVNDGHNFATPKDEAAAAILEQDNTSEFLDIFDDGDEDSDDSSSGPVGGSSRDPAPPSPSEPESDDDDVQEVVPQNRQNNTILRMHLLGLHTATFMAPCVIKPKNPRQALTGPHNKEWREAMDAKVKDSESRDTWVSIMQQLKEGESFRASGSSV